jgi:ubiquitin carboxyl-terminal hydrolase L3
MSRYLHKLGADADNKYTFHDVYGVDDEMLAMVPQPVLAVLLLFPISAASEAHRDSERAVILGDEKQGIAQQKVSPNLFYMHQTTGNACGTVGLTHAAMNLRDVLGLAEDSFFGRFLGETQALSPEQRATALDQNQTISQEHESIASAGVTSAQDAMQTNLHFIAFVACDGDLYELDGRKAGPVNHGPTSEGRLLHDSVKVIKGVSSCMERKRNE